MPTDLEIVASKLILEAKLRKSSLKSWRGRFFLLQGYGGHMLSEPLMV